MKERLDEVVQERNRWLSEALPIVERLVALDPRNFRWQEDLAWLRSQLGK